MMVPAFDPAGFARCRAPILRALAVLVGLLPATPAGAQATWTNLTNGDRIRGLGSNPTTLWAATNGGVVELDKATGGRTFFNRANARFPQNDVTAIHAEPNGDAWIYEAATVTRFDGVSWHRLTAAELPFTAINMLTDNRGTLWLHDRASSTIPHLAQWDGSGWRVVNAGSNLVGLRATSIAQDNAAALWVGMYPGFALNAWHDGGLFRFDGTAWTKFTHTNSTLPSNFVSSLAVDSDGALWVATLAFLGDDITGTRGGLSRYDQGVWTHFQTDNSGIPSETIRCLAIDSQGVKWLGTDVGLVRFDGATWTVFDTSNSSLPSNNVTQVHIDADDAIWVGTGDAGLARFANGGWVTYDTSNSPMPLATYGNSQYGVQVLKRDHRGNIWAGLFQDGGVLRISGDVWTAYDTSNSPLPSDFIFDIAFEQNDTAWIATPSGVAAFDGTNWRVFRAANSSLRQDYARCVAVDPVTGAVWVGNQLGLARFDGVTWTHYDESNSGMVSHYIDAIVTDATGNLYVSIRNPGNFGVLMKFDGAAWTELVRTQYEVPDALVVSADGALWANWPNWGFVPEGGIVRIDAAGTQFFNRTNSAIPDNYVMSLAHDGNSLWVGGASVGVARFNGQTWQNFNRGNSGIAADRVEAIAVDDHGAVWFGGSSGISIYSDGSISIPVVVQDLQAAPEPGGIRLKWRLLDADPSVTGIEVERAGVSQGPYRVLTHEPLAPAARMEFHDTTVNPGETYWYRVVLAGPRGDRHASMPVQVTGEAARWRTSLEVGAPTLDREVAVRYTIGGAPCPARLEIVDVSGRRVATLDQGVRSAGPYVRSWNGLDDHRRRIGRGVYFVVLTAGEARLARKLVLAR